MASSSSLIVHPLCIASICDHYTRLINGGSKNHPDTYSIGLLFGTNSISGLTVYDAVECVYDIINDDIIINIDSVNRIKSLLIGVYPSYELVGWYINGSEINEALIKVHRVFMSILPTPILCLLNYHLSQDSAQIPLTFYESINHLKQTSLSLSFNEIPFRLETIHIEKLAIDQVTKSANQNTSLTLLETDNKTITTSITTLMGKIDLVISVLQKMKSGELPYDMILVRKASKIIQMLPQYPSPEFENNFDMNLLESFMISYLSLVTKTSKELFELSMLVNKTGTSIGTTKTYTMMK